MKEKPDGEEPEVKIWFGPCGKITFDPPVSFEVALAIKREIDEGIARANDMCRGMWER